jgi:hypothetical protein
MFKIGAGIIVSGPQIIVVSPHLLTRTVLIFGARIIGTIRPVKFESYLVTETGFKMGAGIIGTGANPLTYLPKTTYESGPKTGERPASGRTDAFYDP